MKVIGRFKGEYLNAFLYVIIKFIVLFHSKLTYCILNAFLYGNVDIYFRRLEKRDNIIMEHAL
jgi:hypothetical protein